MDHLGTEDEMEQAWRDILAKFSPEERLKGLSAEERLEGLPPEKRLEGLSPEERLRGMTAAEREHLRLLLERSAQRDAGASNGK